MASSKTKVYFWLKIDENFYKNLAIKKARKLPGGDTMIVIYQRMMLLSLSTNGVLYYEGEMQSLDEELALNLDESIENISMTLSYFKASGLIQVDDEENADMLQVHALLDQETNWAKYQRNRRKKDRELLEQVTEQPTLDNVQPVSNSCPTEIEIEKEQELELKKELELEEEIKIELANAVQKIKSLPLLLLSDLTDKNLIFLTDALKKYKFQDLIGMAEYKWSEWQSWKDREKMFTVNTLFSDKNLKPYMDDFNKQSRKREKQPNWDKQEVPKVSAEDKVSAAAMMEELSGEQE
ncbi:phage replisome organizer N-terminal domain-containing protein [Weissella tructae]|uniref:phage replisome organizer N-terminal domain-containing protein n=1 Tax=Weissella tructae TaxID=887702 RepID=UPI003D943FC1